MAHRPFILVGLLLATAACSDSSTDMEAVSLDRVEEASTLGLSSGTSFGMCMGYCTTELVMDSSTIQFIETGRPAKSQPPKTRTLSLTLVEWNRLRGLVNPAVLESLGGIHGCPDCADGGAEWIEIEASSGTVRVTFEYGAIVDPIAQLQSEIRSLRARFPRP